MSFLSLKVPPVVLFLVCLALVFGTYYWFPQLSYYFAYKVVLSRIFLVAGLFCGVLGVLAFRLHGTSTKPNDPGVASSLVTSGIYRFSRNPMYLGLALILIGAVIRIGNFVALSVLPLFVLYITYFQIMPEESVLSQKFPEDFEAYKNTTRRWI
ncbi:MAG: isoprenylcysteine carboxylmethyltransferase family protein [Bacteroidota bacterium]